MGGFFLTKIYILKFGFGVCLARLLELRLAVVFLAANSILNIGADSQFLPVFFGQFESFEYMEDQSGNLPQQEPDETQLHSQPHEPFFNLPAIVTVAFALMVLIEAAKQFMPPADIQNILLQTAFIPARYGAEGTAMDGAWLWSPLTYSLLHGGWLHLIVNCFWLAAFGSIVARRIGNLRFVLFWIASAIAAAAFFGLFHLDEFVIMVGASGVVSALMGAAVRFAFPRRGGFNRVNAHLNARLSIRDALSNRTVFTFLAVWFGINFLAAFGLAPGAGETAIAWEAHVGGLLFGFFAFSLFDALPQGGHPVKPKFYQWP